MTTGIFDHFWDLPGTTPPMDIPMPTLSDFAGWLILALLVWIGWFARRGRSAKEMESLMDDAASAIAIMAKTADGGWEFTVPSHDGNFLAGGGVITFPSGVLTPRDALDFAMELCETDALDTPTEATMKSARARKAAAK